MAATAQGRSYLYIQQEEAGSPEDDPTRTPLIGQSRFDLRK